MYILTQNNDTDTDIFSVETAQNAFLALRLFSEIGGISHNVTNVVMKVTLGLFLIIATLYLILWILSQFDFDISQIVTYLTVVTYFS